MQIFDEECHTNDDFDVLSLKRSIEQIGDERLLHVPTEWRMLMVISLEFIDVVQLSGVTRVMHATEFDELLLRFGIVPAFEDNLFREHPVHEQMIDLLQILFRVGHQRGDAHHERVDSRRRERTFEEAVERLHSREGRCDPRWIVHGGRTGAEQEDRANVGHRFELRGGLLEELIGDDHGGRVFPVRGEELRAFRGIDERVEGGEETAKASERVLIDRIGAVRVGIEPNDERLAADR